MTFVVSTPWIVSADVLFTPAFVGYAKHVKEHGKLDMIVFDEAHVAVKDSTWR